MTVSTAQLLYPLLVRLGPKLTSHIHAQINPGARWYMVPGLSPDEFQKRLHERAIGSVLLPPMPGATQLELLVGDEESGRLRDLITKWPLGPAVKIYSVTGAAGAFRFEPPGTRGASQYSMALFPPQLARALISRAVPGREHCSVLDHADSFLACAYRAAYLHHDAWISADAGWVATPEFESRLQALAADAGIALAEPVTPSKLDQLLAERGWRPTIDLLERAANWMPWLRDTLDPDDEGEQPGLTAFFIRERAVAAGFEAAIIEGLRGSGFEPITTVPLTCDQIEAIANEVRGGNWGPGPFQVSGGLPSSLCIALDLLPVTADATHGGEHPDSDNGRILSAKTAARTLVNRTLPKEEQFNPIHSTDNSRQAWRAVRTIIPEREAELRQKVDQLRRDFVRPGAIRDLTKFGRRAKIELVEFEGQIAVRKSFRPTALRFMHREAEVMERLAPVCREIPRLLHRADSYIIVEYVGGGTELEPWAGGGRPPKPLPLAHVRKLAELIKTIVANGFDPVDLRADRNVLYGPTGLKLIDFEFWRPCDPSMKPEYSMCLAGIPPNDEGDRPRGDRFNLEPYRIGWYPYTQLPLNSFLHDPAWLQRLRRSAIYGATLAGWFVPALLRVAARGVRSGGRKTLAFTLTAIIGKQACRDAT